MIAVWIVGIGFGVILATVAVLFVIAVRNYEPDADTRHSLDCLDWRRAGQRDNTCTAHHGTDWFSTAQDRVRLSNELDGQLWIQEKK